MQLFPPAGKSRGGMVGFEERTLTDINGLLWTDDRHAVRHLPTIKQSLLLKNGTVPDMGR